MPKVAVVLSGCGVFDGSEIHEAVSVLLHLSRHNAAYQCFAPDADQAHVVDHLTGKPVPGERRNVLVESARIARGQIHPLSELRATDYDAVFFPGGFGAARNLCDFAERGARCTVDPDVERVVRAFHAAGKPVGMCCIAPVIAARVLGRSAGGPGVSVTVGGDSPASQAVTAMGARHVVQPVDQALVDPQNHLVTAPAYMYEAPIHAVYDGIGEMVSKALSLIPAHAAR